MSICKCGSDQPCPVHPTSITCELCHREEATGWTIEQRYDQHTGIGYYEAVPVCNDDMPRVASGDRPDDMVAVAHGLGLLANAPWV